MVQGDIRKIVREIRMARPSGREFLILTGRKKQNVKMKSFPFCHPMIHLSMLPDFLTA